MFVWPEPQAGTVYLPCFREGRLGGHTIEEYCVGLAERESSERVMLVSATVYGSARNAYAEGRYFA